MTNNTAVGKRLRFAWHATSIDASIASVRIRCIQVMNGLNALGIDAEPFQFSKAKEYTGVVFSKAYTDADLALAHTLKNQSIIVIFDICDNHIYGFDSKAELRERFNRLTAMIALADVIVCSTEVLKEEIIKHFAEVKNKISVIQDMIDAAETSSQHNIFFTLRSRFHTFKLHKFIKNNKDALNLVWFGNHGVGHAESGMTELNSVRNVIEEYAQTYPVTLTVMSNSFKKYLSVCKNWEIPTCYVQWNIEKFSEWLRLHDVAIMPITKNPFTLSKTNNRPVTALMNGLGVIADSIPSYAELRPYIWLDDWKNALLAYGRDISGNEKEKIANVQLYLSENYSSSVISNRWKVLLEQLPLTDLTH